MNKKKEITFFNKYKIRLSEKALKSGVISLIAAYCIGFVYVLMPYKDIIFYYMRSSLFVQIKAFLSYTATISLICLALIFLSIMFLFYLLFDKNTVVIDLLFFRYEAKRGQFFIIAAIVVCLLIYPLTVSYNTLTPSIDIAQLNNFNDKTDNFNWESSKVVNYAIFYAPPACINTDYAISNPECPAGALGAYSEHFVNYAKQSDPNYGLVYAYKMPDGSIIVKNMLGGWFNEKEGEAQTIRIEGYDTSVRGSPKKVPIEGDILLSTQEYTTGSIQVAGLPAVSAKAKVSNFGEGFSQTVVKGADRIVIKRPSGQPPIIIDLTSASKLAKAQQSKDRAGNTEVIVTKS